MALGDKIELEVDIENSGHLVSVATTQLWSCNTQEVSDNLGIDVVPGSPQSFTYE